MGRAFAAVGLLIGALVSTSGCKDPKPELAQLSAREALNHVHQAREGVTNLLQNFVPMLELLAPSLATPLAASQVENVRNALLDMNSRMIGGRSISLYPTGFVVAVGRDGNAVARNVEANDLMRGMPLAGMFPSIQAALTGTSGLSVGELPVPNVPSRVYVVAAVPVKDAQNNVVGALASGISYGRMTEALERVIRGHSGQQPVIWVGLRRRGRILPSGHDGDVAQRWIIPQALVSAVPSDADAKLQAGNGETSWPFIENGVRAWGAALGNAPMLDDTAILVYRSEAEQR